MGKEYLKLLLRKYLRSEATKEEKSYIEKYYALFENEPDVLDTLSAEEKSKLRTEIKEAIDRSVVQKEHGGKIIPIFRKKAIVVAAAAVATIIVISAVYRIMGLSGKKETAMLTVQAQSNQTILLSDGSKIIMYPGSNLRYPADFGGQEKREVFLDGQAYFAIAHRPSQPFIVYTGKIQTKVLGTAFCIKAFGSDNNVSVTVTGGKVQVSDDNRQLGVLVRNEQILYDKKKELFVQNRVNSDSLSSWAKQELVIDNLTLAEAVRLLEKQFNVEIKLSDKMNSSKRFNATFPPTANLDQALKVVCGFNEVKYYYGNQADSVLIEK